MTPQQLGDMPAFPHLQDTCQRNKESEHWPGLTKREVFAALAMAGMLGSPLTLDTDWLVDHCVVAADALLARLAAQGDAQ